jgi:NTE family protein
MTKIGLALGNGGSRGLAHVGVLKALVENKIKIDSITGTSIGAMIGGIFAATQDIKLLEGLIQKLNFQSMVKILAGLPQGGGFLDSSRVEKYILDNVGDYQIEKLPIKFAAVSADIITGQKVIFNHGSLAAAIRASTAIPGIFSPVEIGQQLLIDGGQVEPVPVPTLQKLFNPQKIIAVGLHQNMFPQQFKKPISLPQVSYCSIQLIGSVLSDHNLAPADVVILPPVDDINLLDFIKAKDYVEIGYQSTLKQIPAIKKLNSFWSIFH